MANSHKDDTVAVGKLGTPRTKASVRHGTPVADVPSLVADDQVAANDAHDVHDADHFAAAHEGAVHGHDDHDAGPDAHGSKVAKEGDGTAPFAGVEELLVRTLAQHATPANEAPTAPHRPGPTPGSITVHNPTDVPVEGDEEGVDTSSRLEHKVRSPGPTA